MTILPMPRTARGRWQAPSGLYWRTVLVVALAFALRCWFILGGMVDHPVRGDAVQYCEYAWNLVHSHVFSMTLPGSENVVPDSFRDPGYPLFLAGFVALWGMGDTWYHAVLMTQAAVGALSAGLAVLVAARWLGLRSSMFAGLAVAIWPHSVAISGFLLSETLFGFMVLLAVWLLAQASESVAPWRWAAAGLCFGAAALVNATLTLFCPLLALSLMARKVAPRLLLVALLVGSLLLPGAWAIRTMNLPAGPSAGSRAVLTLVLGAWSDYHSAYIKSFQGDAQAQQTMAAIDADTQLAQKSTPAWLSVLLGRVERDPVHYLAWYSWKPELMWAWNIRVGAGDVYPYPIFHPIFSTNIIMRLFESLCVGVNPLLFVLMSATVFAALIRPRKWKISVVMYAAAFLVAYETLVYSVLQSEPRYSIPFRPFEMMLAATATHWLWQLWQERKTRSTAADIPLAPAE